MADVSHRPHTYPDHYYLWKPAPAAPKLACSPDEGYMALWSGTLGSEGMHMPICGCVGRVRRSIICVTVLSCYVCGARIYVRTTEPLANILGQTESSLDGCPRP